MRRVGNRALGVAIASRACIRVWLRSLPFLSPSHCNLRPSIFRFQCLDHALLLPLQIPMGMAPMQMMQPGYGQPMSPGQYPPQQQVPYGYGGSHVRIAAYPLTSVHVCSPCLCCALALRPYTRSLLARSFCNCFLRPWTPFAPSLAEVAQLIRLYHLVPSRCLPIVMYVQRPSPAWLTAPRSSRCTRRTKPSIIVAWLTSGFFVN